MYCLDSVVQKVKISVTYLLTGLAALLLFSIFYGFTQSPVYATELTIVKPSTLLAQVDCSDKEYAYSPSCPNWVGFTDCSKDENKAEPDCVKQCKSIVDDSGGHLTCKNVNLIEDENGRKADRFYDEVVRYINYFSIGIGIIAVLGLVISGIQYSAAQENPQAIAAAKQRILNVVIGIFLYVFMFAILQWLIPGGLF